MKRILLSTDFSDNAMNAIEYGLNLYGSEGVQYSLLNTYHEPGSTATSMVSISEYLRKESQELLEKSVNELRAKYPDYSIDTISKYGSLYGVINAFAKKDTIDAVVVGTKGASQMENFFLGSNTMDVLKNVEIPTVIVPKGSTYQGIKTIALAVDLKPLKDLSILTPVLDLAKKEGAFISAVHIEAPWDKSMKIETPEADQLNEYLEPFAHEFETVEHENIAAGIGAFADEKQADLLAIIARKHNFVERLFQKSITKEVSLMAAFPMYIVRE